MAVNERQRMQYLEAMGVDTYMPSLLLPNAPQTVRCQAPVIESSGYAANDRVAIEVPASASPLSPASDLVVETTASTSVERDSIPSQSTPAVEAVIDDVLANVTGDASRDSRGAAPKVVASGTAASGAVASGTSEVQSELSNRLAEPFSLSCWAVGEDLLVVDSRHSEQALPVERLLQNILVALGYPPRALPAAEVIRWPLMSHRLADRDEDSARTTAQFTVEGFVRSHNLKKVLLMGLEATHFVLPEADADQPQDMAARFEQFVIAQPGSLELPGETVVEVVVTPSLSDMLLKPLTKAAAWRSLQPFRMDLSQ